jgi:hypothetical protein
MDLKWRSTERVGRNAKCQIRKSELTAFGAFVTIWDACHETENRSMYAVLLD